MDYKKMYKERYGVLNFKEMEKEELEETLEKINDNLDYMAENLAVVNRNSSRPSSWGDIGDLSSQKEDIDIIANRCFYRELKKRGKL